MATSLRDAFRASGHSVRDADLVRERRTATLFGRDFELCWIPGRAQRAGVPGAGRPSFRRHPGDRIRRDEVFWKRGSLLATPNRFPFVGDSLLLWEDGGSAREVGESHLAAAFALADECDAALLVNTVGASASIPLAHAHFLFDVRPLLEQAWTGVEIGSVPQGRLLAPSPDGDWPLFAAIVECEDPARRARWVRHLLDVRTHAAANILAQGRRAIVVPRRGELGGLDFPYAIGAGELSGRFVFPSLETMRAAGAQGLEASLRGATTGVTGAEISGLRELWPTLAAL